MALRRFHEVVLGWSRQLLPAAADIIGPSTIE
jgi:hypothetical protein